MLQKDIHVAEPVSPGRQVNSLLPLVNFVAGCLRFTFRVAGLLLKVSVRVVIFMVVFVFHMTRME